MRTVLLCNNRLGAAVGEYLLSRDELLGIVIHPEPRRKHQSRLLALGVPTWVWPGDLEEVRAVDPDCLLSVLFGYIVSPEWLGIPRWKALNLHPGHLPWNRGAAPNVWPLVDGSPAGVTLHEMDATLDTGAIICRQEVQVHPDDTARSLYVRLEAVALAMFMQVWPDVRAVRPSPQEGTGSSHRLADLSTLDLRDEDLGVIDRLRALMFPPYTAVFERDGQRFRVRIDIEPVS